MNKPDQTQKSPADRKHDEQLDAEKLWAVPAIDDPDMEARMAIVRPRQLRNPRGSALLVLQTEWARMKGLL